MKPKFLILVFLVCFLSGSQLIPNVWGATSNFGENPNSGSSYISTSANYMYGGSYSCNVTGSVNSITFYGRGASGGYVKAVICNSSGYILTNGVSNALSFPATAASYTPTYTNKPDVTSGQTYWIMIIASVAGRLYYYSTTGGSSKTDSTNSYTTPTNPTDASSGTYRWRQMFATVQVPTTYPVTSPITGTIGLSTIVRVNCSLTLSQTNTLSLNLGVESGAASLVTGTVTFDTAVQVQSYLSTTAGVSVGLELANRGEPAISSDLTGTVTFDVEVVTIYHVDLSESNSIGMELEIVKTGGVGTNYDVPLDLTGTFTFDMDIQVQYGISMTESPSIGLNLDSGTEFILPSKVTGTITLDIDVQVQSGASPSITGTIALDMLVEASYHVALTESSTVNINLEVTQTTSTTYAVPINVTGVLGLDVVTEVSYHLTTTESQTFTFTSETGVLNYNEPLSLTPNIDLYVSISGNFSLSPPSVDPSGSVGNPSRSVFDVKIVRIAFVYQFQQQLSLTRTLEVTVAASNFGTLSGDTVMAWWITNALQKEVGSSSQTLFIGAGESKQIVCCYDDLDDLKEGDYVFNAEAKSVGGNVLPTQAIATLEFSVGNIYADFVKENIIIIAPASLLGVLALARVRRKPFYKRRKRHKK